MPARVVIVNDDPDDLAQAADGLRRAGYDVATFQDPLAALDALSAGTTAELLITMLQFGPGKPHGVSLALMAKHRQYIAQVLFTAFPDVAEHASRVGEVLIAPVAVPDLVKAVDRMLKPDKTMERPLVA
jgi:DNA-binding NtrC family response regulator